MAPKMTAPFQGSRNPCQKSPLACSAPPPSPAHDPALGCPPCPSSCPLQSQKEAPWQPPTGQGGGLQTQQMPPTEATWWLSGALLVLGGGRCLPPREESGFVFWFLALLSPPLAAFPFLPCLSLSPLPLLLLTGGCICKEMLPLGGEHRGGEGNVFRFCDFILTWPHCSRCLEAQPCPLRPWGTCFFILQGGVLLSAPSVGSLPLGLSMGCSWRLQVPQGPRLAFYSAFTAV